MKKKVFTKSRPIRSGLIIAILLLPALLPTIRISASETADSVYFHIELDTLGSIRTGQVLQLTYTLVNSRFDTASYPVFNDSIEVLSGPKPHKCESYSLINGVEHKSRETGFYYLVRFRYGGETRIPVASVTAEGKTYTTPECRLSVHPAEVDISTLKCDLKVERLKDNYAKYCATLTCNVRPDQNPPLLTINGKTIQPHSKSYSNSHGKEEYVYRYYFTSDGYEVSCEELTFGGIPYSVKPQKSKMDNSDFLLECNIGRTNIHYVWPRLVWDNSANKLNKRTLIVHSTATSGTKRQRNID